MSETGRTIDELSRVHEAIRHHVTRVKESIAELERMSSQRSGEFNSDQYKTITDRQFNLRQSLQYLREGIQEHHRQESLLLTPLVGVLIRAVNIECSEITKQFEEVNAALASAGRSQLRPTDLAIELKQARELMETFSSLVENHSRKMDSILEMLREATS
jgi:hypothetical protein